jgi:CheY-like chemotaxis protein
MTNIDGALCILCGNPITQNMIQSAQTVEMGSLSKTNWACISHFYSDGERKTPVSNKERNMEIMAMAVGWDLDSTKRIESSRDMVDDHYLKGKRVLIVEDHLESAELLKKVFESEGCEVKCVKTGTDALQIFTPVNTEKASDFDPDLVLLDLRLPDMTGVVLVEEMRKRQSTVPPLIMISADTPSSLTEAADRVGAIGVHKPFEFDELFTAITTAMDRPA